MSYHFFKKILIIFILPTLFACQNNAQPSNESKETPSIEIITHKVSFYNENGTEPLQVVEVIDGEEAIYTGITPTKESDDYQYNWSGWDHELINVKEDFSTYALYTKKLIETEGLVYTLNEDEESYTVSEYTGSSVNIIVPNIHNDLPVTHIGDEAFMYKNNDENRNCKNIETIKIANGIIELGKSCFAQLEFLKSINLPQSITKMGVNVFHGKNSSLKSIQLPDEIKRIEQYSFAYCVALESIHLPDKLEYLGKIAFAQCENLKDVVIPPNVYAIGYGCFQNCISLKSINIPGKVETIAPTNKSRPGYYVSGVGPFKGCKNLAEITVDKNNKLFYAVDNVLYYKDGETKILYLYAPAKLETEFTISKDITVIRDSAFYGAMNLEKINTEEDSKLKNIEIEAFSNCTGLNEIFIPISVVVIKIRAFNGCSIRNFLCEIEEKQKPEGWEDGYIPINIEPKWGQTRV